MSVSGHHQALSAADEHVSGIHSVEGRRRASLRGRRGWIMRRALLVADVVGLLLAFLTAGVIVGAAESGARLLVSTEVGLLVVCLPLWVVGAKLAGLYDRDDEQAAGSTLGDVWFIAVIVTVGTWFFTVVDWLTSVADPGFGKLVVFWLSAILLVPTARVVARGVCRRLPSYVQRTVIIGNGDDAERLVEKIRRHPEWGIDLVGVAGTADAWSLQLASEAPDDLRSIGRFHNVDRVILTSTDAASAEFVRALSDENVRVDVVPGARDLIGTHVGVYSLEGVVLLALPRIRLSRSSRAVKRGFDLCLTVPGLLVISPLLLLVAVAIKLDSRGPVLFRQTRIGEHGEPFRILKFRSMSQDAEEQKETVRHLNRHAVEGGDDRMFKIEHDPRVTRVGSLLRRMSLDELPQLVNVVRGEMSLVGPRPLIPEEARCVDAWAKRRLDLKPGITGIWQVNGASAIDFEEMVKLDYAYVTSWSLRRDLELLLRTVPVVFGRRTNW